MEENLGFLKDNLLTEFEKKEAILK